ncbi:MAG: insulinase family protein [Bacteroidetes bacterium]|nr:insulinase family protein [Bacteroidota bacterium]
MKKTLILLISLLFISMSVSAQEMMRVPTMPNDPAVRMGVLENGMTYYIMKNNKPAETANFHLVTNVGAVQETDAQNGLAHFLEHMAFNGIKSFKGNSMIEYLKSKGLGFGSNINASTGLDVTQYFISNVPVEDKMLMDSVMIILHDWSHYIQLDKKDIDEERGVIIEELRSGNGAGRRVLEKRLAEFGNGTIYSQRNVIGTLDNLKGFEHKQIRAFYDEWYRPSLQAVIIVGDIDVDATEKKVIELFSSVPQNKTASEKKFFEIPDYEKTYSKIYVDKELTSTDLWIALPTNEANIVQNNWIQFVVTNFMFDIIDKALSKRFEKISQSPDSPFNYAMQVSERILHPQQLALTIGMLKEGRELEATEAIATEINRMKKHGINKGELQILLKEISKEAESAYKSRNDRENTSLAMAMVANFTENLPITEPKMQYDFVKNMVATIDVEMVNDYIWRLFKDKKSFISMSTKGTEITETQLLDAYNKGMTAKVKPLKDIIVDSNLLDKSALVAGTIKNSTDYLYDSEEFTLSNGAKVIFKKTDLKNDEVLFFATKNGGASIFEDSDYGVSQLLSQYMNYGMNGVSKYSSTDLQNALAGTKVNVTASFYKYYSALNGECSPSDLEKLFQLIRLNLTEPRFEQQEIDAFKSIIKQQFASYTNNPDMAFSNEIMEFTASNSKRSGSFKEQLNSLDMFTSKKAMAMFNQAFCGVGDMTFVFVGNADKEQVRKFSELYLSSLPMGESAKMVNRYAFEKGLKNKNIVFKQQDDKANVLISIENKIDENVKTHVAFNVINDILSNRYTKIIREEMGATYGVRNYDSFEWTPNGEFINFSASYSTNDKQVEATSKVILGELNKMADGEISKDEFSKVISNLQKNFKINKERNSFWVDHIYNNITRDFDGYSDYEEVLNGLTIKDLSAYSKMMIKGASIHELKMTSK